MVCWSFSTCYVDILVFFLPRLLKACLFLYYTQLIALVFLQRLYHELPDMYISRLKLFLSTVFLLVSCLRWFQNLLVEICTHKYFSLKNQDRACHLMWGGCGVPFSAQIHIPFFQSRFHICPFLLALFHMVLFSLTCFSYLILLSCLRRLKTRSGRWHSDTTFVRLHEVNPFSSR